MAPASQQSAPRRIVIVGGGFGGVCAALELSKRRIPNVKITLINATTYMQYYAALYRVATGGSPLEVCIPLSTIFEDTDVEVVTDFVVSGDTASKTLMGKSGSTYHYDELILAPGSQAASFGIPGIEDHAFGIQSVGDALRLKRHVREVFQAAKGGSAATVAVVGGGATGIELAGSLASYAKSVAAQNGLDPSLVKIHLIEAAERLSPALPQSMSARLQKQLMKLGVQVSLNQAVTQVTPDELVLKDSRMRTKTVVWTAGIKANALLAAVKGLTLDRRGRVAVDQDLQAVGCPNVYAIGDGAATQYAGMAQTAVEDGRFVGEYLAAKIGNRKLPSYQATPPAYAIPAGNNWAAVKMGAFIVYGRLGWFMRRVADFIAFNCVLPPFKAFEVFLDGNEGADEEPSTHEEAAAR